MHCTSFGIEHFEIAPSNIFLTDVSDVDPFEERGFLKNTDSKRVLSVPFVIHFWFHSNRTGRL